MEPLWELIHGSVVGEEKGKKAALGPVPQQFSLALSLSLREKVQ